MIKRIQIPVNLVEDISLLSVTESNHILNNICSYLPKEISTRSIILWAKQFQQFIIENNEVLLFNVDKDLTDQKLRLMYACIAVGLGKLNNSYGYFFDVMDRGQDYISNDVAVSKTNAETSFHTDSTSKDYSPNIVGLLCIQNSKIGGESLIADAEKLFDYLSNEHPNILPVLKEPTIRDVITRNSSESMLTIEENTIPIYEDTANGIKFRYMRYWIERAHEKLNKNIPTELDYAMNIIDNYFNEQDNHYEFKMNRGEMLFINNHKMAHNRKKFEDSDSKRLLVRTWID